MLDGILDVLVKAVADKALRPGYGILDRPTVRLSMTYDGDAIDAEKGDAAILRVVHSSGKVVESRGERSMARLVRWAGPTAAGP